MKVLLNLNLIGKDFKVKYLDIKIDENLNWKHHVNKVSAKLVMANVILFKIRNYANPKIIRSIYFAIFESHLNYFYLVWTQNSGSIKQLVILQ